MYVAKHQNLVALVLGMHVCLKMFVILFYSSNVVLSFNTYPESKTKSSRIFSSLKRAKSLLVMVKTGLAGRNRLYVKNIFKTRGTDFGLSPSKSARWHSMDCISSRLFKIAFLKNDKRKNNKNKNKNKNKQEATSNKQEATLIHQSDTLRLLLLWRPGNRADVKNSKVVSEFNFETTK